MRWVLGLDLRPSTRGAMHFAQWLVKSSHDDGPTMAPDDEIVGVHVLEREQLAPLFRLQAPERVVEKAHATAQETLKEAGAADLCSAVEIELDPDGAAKLLSKVAVHGADGLIVGREQKQTSTATIRLGPTAHRILRHKKAPVIVAPPNLTPQAIENGPVIVATDLELHSVSAARFGEAFARAHGRELLHCHVVPDPRGSMAPFLAEETLDDMSTEHVQQARSRFESWCEEYGLGKSELRVAMGDPVDALSDVALETRSPLLVVGTEGKSAIERFFVGSVALELAANAPCCVAVVPSG